MDLVTGNRLPWWRSKYILWTFFTIPALLFCIEYFKHNIKYEELMHITGEFSGRLLFFVLIATPLSIIFPRFKFPKWLNRNKRYFGVASFAYALIHAVVYLTYVSLNQVWEDFFKIGLLTAWIAFIIWIPMAVTSTDGWVIFLKSKWKKIHNWGYLAALLAFIHWAFIHYHWQGALVHALPVAALQIYRWVKKYFE
jgi:sulfoxide reductase heme-binding subunit YedZ